MKTYLQLIFEVRTIRSKEDAEKAIAHAHYPPIGKRGVGLSRAQGYGKSFDKYLLDLIIILLVL